MGYADEWSVWLRREGVRVEDEQGHIDDSLPQQAELAWVSADLIRAFPGVLPETVNELVKSAAAGLNSGARFTEFIPVLVRNQVGTALRRSAA
jgi:hypothetical protein